MLALIISDRDDKSQITDSIEIIVRDSSLYNIYHNIVQTRERAESVLAAGFRNRR